MTRIFFILTIWLLCYNITISNGQQSIQLIDKESMSVIDSINNIEKKSINHQFNLYINTYQQAGYLLANIDSIAMLSDTLTVGYLYKGPLFKWASINTEKIPSYIIKEALRDIGLIQGKPIKPSHFASITKSILDYCDNLGYPFANITFINNRISENNTLHTELNLSLGKQYTIDSIYVEYPETLNERFFFSYLGIKKGMIYKAEKLKTLTQLINDLPYLESERDWELNFGVNENNLHLFLKKRNANQANAIIGMQPTNNPDKRFDFTADVLLSFQNEIGYGEKLKFQYQQLQNNSPKLNIELMWPYIMGTPLGWEGKFDYQKYDTSFRKTNGNMGVVYQLNAKDQIKVFYELQSVRTIAFDTTFVRNNKILPPNVDVVSNGGGVGLTINRLNNTLNPNKGYAIQLSGIASNRNIIKNNSIDNISDATTYDYNIMYDTLKKNMLQAKIQTTFASYLAIKQLFTIKIGYDNGYLSGDNLFMNEMFQLGGFKLLRGFNELSIFSPHYHIATIEPRILISRLSYLYLFSDMAYLSIYNKEKNNPFIQAFSIGAGGTLNTESGIFNIAFGLGKQGNEALEFKNLRVHFGYAVQF